MLEKLDPFYSFLSPPARNYSHKDKSYGLVLLNVFIVS